MKSARTQLNEGLKQCAAMAGEGTLNIGALINALGTASFGVIGLLHALPFLQPISLGPLTSAMSVSVMIIGIQMMLGHTGPRLPKRVLDLQLHGKVWLILLNTCEKVVTFVGKFSRPRIGFLTTGRIGRLVMGGMLVIGGFLLLLPLPFIPASNIPPAVVLVLVCLAELEGDGLLVLLSVGAAVATVVYFSLFGVLIYEACLKLWNSGWIRWLAETYLFDCSGVAMTFAIIAYTLFFGAATLEFLKRRALAERLLFSAWLSLLIVMAYAAMHFVNLPLGGAPSLDTVLSVYSNVLNALCAGIVGTVVFLLGRIYPGTPAERKRVVAWVVVGILFVATVQLISYATRTREMRAKPVPTVIQSPRGG